jgi:hypothetical protein
VFGLYYRVNSIQPEVVTTHGYPVSEFRGV